MIATVHLGDTDLTESVMEGGVQFSAQTQDDDGNASLNAASVMLSALAGVPTGLTDPRTQPTARIGVGGQTLLTGTVRRESVVVDVDQETVGYEVVAKDKLFIERMKQLDVNPTLTQSPVSFTAVKTVNVTRTVYAFHLWQLLQAAASACGFTLVRYGSVPDYYVGGKGENTSPLLPEMTAYDLWMEIVRIENAVWYVEGTSIHYRSKHDLFTLRSYDIPLSFPILASMRQTNSSVGVDLMKFAWQREPQIDGVVIRVNPIIPVYSAEQSFSMVVERELRIESKFRPPILIRTTTEIPGYVNPLSVPDYQDDPANLFFRTWIRQDGQREFRALNADQIDYGIEARTTALVDYQVSLIDATSDELGRLMMPYARVQSPIANPPTPYWYVRSATLDLDNETAVLSAFGWLP